MQIVENILWVLPKAQQGKSNCGISSVLNVGYQGNVGCRNRMSDFRFRRYFGAI